MKELASIIQVLPFITKDYYKGKSARSNQDAHVYIYVTLRDIPDDIQLFCGKWRKTFCASLNIHGGKPSL